MNPVSPEIPLQLSKFNSVQRQISEQLRQEIVQGKLAVGTKLPTAIELAASWGVSTCTVHNALAELVKAGLLKRQRGTGTFVAERKKRLTCAAIYYGADFWTGTELGFYRLLYTAIQTEFEKQGVKTRLIIDSRTPGDQATVYPPLVDAIQSDEVQALVYSLGNRSITPTLRRLPIASAFFTSGLTIPNNVSLDLRQFLETSMDRLQSEGCRSIGLITNMTLENEDGEHTPFHSYFIEAAGERGLEIKNKWIKSAPQHFLSAGKFERFGYDSFRSLWDQPERPDGLIVYPDMVVRGVLMAVTESRVSVPRDLKLALHRNEGIDILCPFPAFWTTSSATQVARALIAQIQRQFDGERIEPIQVPFQVQ